MHPHKNVLLISHSNVAAMLLNLLVLVCVLPVQRISSILVWLTCYLVELNHCGE